MENRIDAIYARQSVDRKDSISIESQIEFCKYELRGGNFKDYKDKGFSGKNTDRPRFQELMADIKRGLIRRVVVYKLDRISRSILDFATMMELFQQYNVEFVSSTESRPVRTPMKRPLKSTRWATATWAPSVWWISAAYLCPWTAASTACVPTPSAAARPAAPGSRFGSWVSITRPTVSGASSPICPPPGNGAMDVSKQYPAANTGGPPCTAALLQIPKLIQAIADWS